MAHFAKLDSNNKVLSVLLVDDKHAATEAKGEAYLRKILNDPTAVWKSSPFNKGTSAGIGRIYDPVKKIFHTKQPYPSWILDEETGIWDAPIPRPYAAEGEDPIFKEWNEDTQQWDDVTPA
tara:strand:+ start:557 stop:919 length:363 start_codon:yes stop_codon:yes gene_type:complete